MITQNYNDINHWAPNVVNIFTSFDPRPRKFRFISPEWTKIVRYKNYFPNFCIFYVFLKSVNYFFDLLFFFVFSPSIIRRLLIRAINRLLKKNVNIFFVNRIFFVNFPLISIRSIYQYYIIQPLVRVRHVYHGSWTLIECQISNFPSFCTKRKKILTNYRTYPKEKKKKIWSDHRRTILFHL